MAVYLLFFLLPWLTTFFANLPLRYSAGWAIERGTSMAITLVLIPLMCAWLTTIAIHYRWPRRSLTRYPGAFRSAAMLGFVSGIAAMTATGLLLWIGDGRAPDGAITAASSILTTMVTLVACKKVQTGLCTTCGYNITASVDFGRCPECGKAIA